MVQHYFLLYLKELRRNIKQEAADALGICNVFGSNFITMLYLKRLDEFWYELILQV